MGNKTLDSDKSPSNEEKFADETFGGTEGIC